jgi:SPP1 gp7 family putative phage head morphogenesis protein
MPRPGKNRRARRPLLPSGIALAYAADLYRVLAYARDLVHERLLTRLPEFVERVEPVRTDAKQPPGRRVNKILDQISEAFFRRYGHDRLEALAEKYMQRTSKFQRDQFEKFAQEALGVSLSGAIDKGVRQTVQNATARNVSLIKSIPQRYFEDVEKTVTQGLAAGKRHEDISKDIEETFGTAQESARLVARNETLTYYAEVNKARQENLGVTEFVWRTVHDERVRSSHAELDGETFSWDDLPENDKGEEIFPGSEINCRCWSEPVLDDLLSE